MENLPPGLEIPTPTITKTIEPALPLPTVEPETLKKRNWVLMLLTG